MTNQQMHIYKYVQSR